MDRKYEKKLAEESLKAVKTIAAAGAKKKTGGSNSGSKKIVFVVGADEAGRGPLCGPVVGGAVVMALDLAANANMKLPKSLELLTDSKKLSEKKRDALTATLKEQVADNKLLSATEWPTDNTPISFSTCRTDAEDIDELNILEASLHCMEQASDDAVAAVQKLADSNPSLTPKPSSDNTFFVVDGPHLPRGMRTDGKKGATAKKAKKKLTDKQQREADARVRLLKPFSSLSSPVSAKAVVSGDSLCATIAAASVIAKTTRDEIMLREVAPAIEKQLGKSLANDFEIRTNFGYPTKKHREAIKKHGIVEPHYRKTFAPVAEAIAATKKKPAPGVNAKKSSSSKAKKSK